MTDRYLAFFGDCLAAFIGALAALILVGFQL